jgi:hypothetical protein
MMSGCAPDLVRGSQLLRPNPAVSVAVPSAASRHLRRPAVVRAPNSMRPSPNWVCEVGDPRASATR